MGTDSCNAGVVNLNWFALPNNDHPVIPQNLYRMSGGATNDDRFEQIGQSNVKHAFTALTQNLCGFGCNGVGRHAARVGMLGSLHGRPELPGPTWARGPGSTPSPARSRAAIPQRGPTATPATRTSARRTGS